MDDADIASLARGLLSCRQTLDREGTVAFLQKIVYSLHGPVASRFPLQFATRLGETGCRWEGMSFASFNWSNTPESDGNTVGQHLPILRPYDLSPCSFRSVASTGSFRLGLGITPSTEKYRTRHRTGPRPVAQSQFDEVWSTSFKSAHVPCN